MARPRILLTLSDAPWPPDRGKRIRAGITLSALAEVGDVDLVVLTDGSAADHLPPGVEVSTATTVPLPLVPSWRAALLAAGTLRPWQIAVRDWAGARTAVAARPQGHDLVWFGATDHAVMLGAHTRAPAVVVDMDDVETAKIRGYLALTGAHVEGDRTTRVQRRVELPLWARLQRRVGRRSDALVVCSDLDRDRVDAPRVAVVPNCYPDPGPPDRSAHVPGRELLLVANYDYEPNLDAAVWLAREVMPLVLRALPGATVRLVGRNGETRLAALVGLPGVEVVGTVADPRVELDRADVVVAPVRFGGGTRIKLLEAFACGVPAITTSLGCEGLDVVDGEQVLVADEPAAFAAACVLLLTDPGRAAAIAASARARYEERYRPEVARRIITTLVADLVPGGGGGAAPAAGR